MIIITGPGRSGTTAVANLYRHCGFDPGGEFDSRVDAGLEDSDIFCLNEEIANHLELPILRLPKTSGSLSTIVGRVGPMLPGGLRTHLRSKWRMSKAMKVGRVQPPNIELRRTLPTALYDRCVDLSRRKTVVKDPQFLWTLPAWVASSAQLEGVVVCVRPFNAVLESRLSAGHINYSTADGFRQSVEMALGGTMQACIDNGVPFEVLRFPDFLSDNTIHSRLPRIRDLPFERFEEARRRAFHAR